jgi:hypothetical protein
MQISYDGLCVAWRHTSTRTKTFAPSSPRLPCQIRGGEATRVPEAVFASVKYQMRRTEGPKDRQGQANTVSLWLKSPGLDPKLRPETLRSSPQESSHKVRRSWFTFGLMRFLPALPLEEVLSSVRTNCVSNKGGQRF